MKRALSRMGVPGACLAALLATGCASVEFQRDTETSGTFRSSAHAFTILSWDLPKAALDTARENASDARQPNLVVEEIDVTPDFGRWDWLMDIIGWRKVVLTGTWGFRDEG